MVEKKCVVCGKTFNATGTMITCGKECAHERQMQWFRAHTKERVIYNLEWRAKKRGQSVKSIRKCEMCDAEFQVTLAGQGNRKRCPECAEIFNDASGKMYSWAFEIRSKFKDMCIISPRDALNFYTDMEREEGKEFAEKLLGRIKENYLSEVSA